MSELTNSLLTNSGYLRINDIEFEIPPERITIVKRDFSNQVSTIRSQTSTVIKSGRRMMTMIVELHFGTGYNALTGEEKNVNSWINKQLAPLLIQVRKCPFVSVENEKIRKELLGIDPAYNDRIIAAVVKDIEISSAARSADNIKVAITMDYFNYTPFTPDFKYKQVLNNGSVAPSNKPAQPFRDFYYSGTTDEKGRLINSITTTKNTGMTILYKQYYELNFGAEGVQQLIASTSTEEEFNLDAVKTAFNAKPQEYEALVPQDKAAALYLDKVKSLGWMEDPNPFRTTQNSRLLYRYKKFEIDGDIYLDSDRLIIEAGTAGLSTVTPNITLQGHTEPTTQFIGCSDARVTFQFFANAHISDNKPVGTSRKLAQLQEILTQGNKNAIRFHRESFNDGIFIRHPLAKLCKYKSYNREKNKIQVFNPVTGQLEVEEINEYLFCHTEDVSSETVPGHPFCSRLTVSFLENYIKENTEAIPATVGLGESAYQAGKNLVKTLAKRFGIQKTDGTFSITDRPLAVTSEEIAIAEKLTASLNTTVQIELVKFPDSLPIRTSSMSSVEEVLDSPLIKNRKSYFRDSLIIQGLDPALTPDPMCYERFGEIMDEIILMVESSESEIYSDYSMSLNVIKNVDAVPNESCYPDMMLPSNQSQPDFAWYNISDGLNSEEEINKMATRVFTMRYELGVQNSEKTGAELPDYLKTENYVAAKWIPSPAANPASKNPSGIPGVSIPDLGMPFFQSPLDPVQQSMVARKSVEKLGDNSYCMRRAMPTMKLYFKDHLPEQEDTVFASNGFWRNFSDVYDLNAVIDIRVAKSQDNPVDMMVIRLTNSRQDLMSKYFEIKNKDDKAVVADLKTKRAAKKATTPEESQKLLGSLEDNQSDKVIREGTRIELRLGYDNDPNNLNVEFVGRIMSASGTDIIEIVCQGDGVELIQELKGVAGTNQKDWSFDGETGEVITKMLANSPEVASFGSMRNIIDGFGETPLPASFGGRSGVENIFAPPLYNSFARFGQKTAQYAGWALLLGIGPGTQPLVPIALKAALIAGVVADTATVIRTAWSGAPFRVYEQTLWDILQELTMRHPGTICSVVPFGNRSTIFFGFPDQLYFYRPANYVEKLRFRGIKPKKKEDWRGNSSGTQSSDDPRNTVLGNSTTRRDAIKNNAGFVSRLGLESESVSREEIENFNKSAAGSISKDAMKPFITYHLITSDHDIVMNDMQVTSEDVFNAVEIVYPETSSDGNFDGSKGFSDYQTTDTILADDDLKKAYIRKQTLVFHNAHKQPLEDMPERYAASNLVKSLENVYKGKIIILGRPNIKPHDVVFIEDFYNKISGPVKVGAVTQVFSYKTGWITEIHPKMLVAPTGSTLMESVLAMKQAAKFRALKNYEIFQTIFTDPKTRGETEDIGKTVRSIPIAVREAAAQASDYAQAAIALQRSRKAFEAAKALRNATLFTRVTSFGTKFLAGPLLAFGLDAAVNRYLSWSRTRQPIAFIPVTRGNKPWVMGLHGFQDNTEMESIKKIASGISANTEDFINRVVEKFRD